MKNIAISRRYAKALLLLGKEDGQAEKYSSELSSIATLLEREPELEQAICNPLYDTADRKKVLELVLEKLELSSVVASFVKLLFEKGRFGFLVTISENYNKLVDELKGIAHASLVSASELSVEAVDKIRTSLSKLTGKDVILDIKQDPGLLGGVVTKIGDLVLDGSVKTQLLNMRESFKKGESV